MSARVLVQTAPAQGQPRGFDARGVGGDFVRAVVARVAQFQAVEGGAAGPGHAGVGRVQAVAAQRVGLVAGGGQERIAPERVVIVEILVARRLAAEPLGEPLGGRGLAGARVAPVGEGWRQRARQPQALIPLAQPPRAAVARKAAAGKIGDDLAGAGVLKEQRWVVTVGLRKGGGGGSWGAVLTSLRTLPPPFRSSRWWNFAARASSPCDTGAGRTAPAR
jgi:hypothetical protein